LNLVSFDFFELDGGLFGKEGTSLKFRNKISNKVAKRTMS